MRLTIIYDNEAARGDLRADWGFACLVEAHGRRILFDTGARGDILLGNMDRLGLDPAAVDTVFISHAHWDHTGGLEAFLEHNATARLYAPESWREAPADREVVRVRPPVELGPGLRSTGELKDVEQSLLVEVEGGLAVVVGCSHSGVGTILRRAERYDRPRALIGGLHRFSDFDALAGLALVCATHCTAHGGEIKRLYPRAWTEGGAGRVIELKDRPAPPGV
ncbi:MAG TPA: MBL fold metallo-hydrolase [bacterium]|nr:MBL fold metallo-hydrolase [bacterium]